MIEIKDTIVNDIKTIIELEQMPENKQFITPYTYKQHLQVINDQNQSHLSIFCDNEFVGFTILSGFQDSPHSIEFRRIVVDAKGKGIGKEVIYKVQKLVFNIEGSHRLWLDVFETNTRARHIYKQLGFLEEGILRDAVKTDDIFQNLVIMSILKHEFKLK
jgi:RimJ/RimL family protein N-acetyltransferase